MNKNIKGISDETMKIFKSYHWPGNIRELQNVIERAVVLCKSDTITPREIPDNLSSIEQNISFDLKEGEDLETVIDRIEKEFILKALKKAGYSQTKTAEILGIKRTTLRYKLEKHGLLHKTIDN
jgi:transcriptional regulator with PAS, ATPase and Fis domain